MTAAVVEENIGPYKTVCKLGEGGMGLVYLAHDDELDRAIAIKLLPQHLAGDEEQLARLKQEARTASSLNHPNIITIYEIGQHESSAFIAMEYIDGQTLRDAMAGGPLPIRKTLQIAAQIADGLSAAHKRGLVHRDLKPENIMLTREGVVKILDFGLARSGASGDAGTSQRKTDPGTIVGTFGYMSPEQAKAGSVDYRSDQFSFGAILYEMLTGTRAFEGASAVETMFMVVRDEPASLAQVAPHVPALLRWVAERCLAKDPDERYASTRDLARDLQHLRDHLSEAGVAPVREEKVEAEVVTARRRWPLVAATALVALLIGALLMSWLRRPAPPTITSEQYLTYSGNDFSPAVSPDGKLVAFSSRRDGRQRIWLKQIEGGSEVALSEGSDDFPRFSPDGASILYVHFLPDGTSSLYRIPVVGGEARRILERATTGELSPDGKQLAFSRNEVDSSGRMTSVILAANANGTGVRELLRSDIVALSQPRWSPDQKQIALIGASGRVAQTIVILHPDTKVAQTLATPAKSGEISVPVWTADSRALIYVRAASVEAVVGSTAQIIRHDVASDTTQVIGWSSHNGTLADVLADGRIILDVRSPRDNLREIALTAATTTPTERWLTRGNSSDRQPVYSPDGQLVLFSSNRSGNLDLWQMNLAAGSVRKITDDAAEDWDPAFTPDGKKIVWSSGRTGNLEIWMANADGSEAHQVSHDGVDAENPTATADGQWILYNSFNQKHLGIWKVHPDGTGASSVVAGRDVVPDVSPDGKYVAFLADGRTTRATVRVVRIADGAMTRLLIRVPAPPHTTAILGRMRWMPDGKSIAFLYVDEHGVNGVFQQDFIADQDTTATRRKLAAFDPERATESFGISRDGRTIAVAGWEQLFSLMAIDGVPGVTAKHTEKKEN
ncbi:MAG TPA: protein kinase [Thermoanaerobaculia bacterium]|jgi:serine/threonine protein kinase|nr:protein kinase [Thermoanaerobaculia bacterium]